KDKLGMIIGKVKDGELGFEYITRSSGLRQKVFELLQNETNISNIPEPTKPTQPIEPVPAERIIPLNSPLRNETEPINPTTPETPVEPAPDVVFEQPSAERQENTEELPDKDLNYYSNFGFVKNIDKQLDKSREDFVSAMQK